MLKLKMLKMFLHTFSTSAHSYTYWFFKLNLEIHRISSEVFLPCSLAILNKIQKPVSKFRLRSVKGEHELLFTG